jgi:hypothetical protein
VAVLGSTGQGKTHFVAALVQQLYRGQGAPRIVVFDINGEYAAAFDNGENGRVRITKVGGGRGGQLNQGRIRIPYYALGRRGLFRLLLPSDRTQAPSLRFAIEHLSLVEADENGARLVGQGENVLFDDARQLGAQLAFDAMNAIRTERTPRAERWPHMRALSCLAAEWYALAPDNRGQPSRNAFNYGHVQSLINRIRGLIEDERFRDVVDVEGGRPLRQGVLDLQAESSALVTEIFGGPADDGDWNVHVVDLSQLTQDLMPFVLGSLLELFAAELFRRGPGQTHPTLLVLEEAHHYMHHESADAEGVAGGLAYERLAKEGRKFGLALLVSTQRPSELSSTVLSQCGTWCVFRLTNEQDQKAVFTAAETGANYILRQMSGLGRGQAIIFGSALPMATLTQVIRADPEPRSSDADFVRRWGGR